MDSGQVLSTGDWFKLRQAQRGGMYDKFYAFRTGIN